MRLAGLSLKNWKNFKNADLELGNRVFVIGPNASGKSNLLDAIRFLRDIADPRGGFQEAVARRGGVSQLRCLHARKDPTIRIVATVENEVSSWSYELEFRQEPRGQRRALVTKEAVKRDGQEILSRPKREDSADPSLLTQTHLEQVRANKDFRILADFFARVRYLHIVPQLVRDSERPRVEHDPYGSDFLEQVARTQPRTRISRLRKIEAALRVAVPQLKSLELARDDATGVPHLRGLYEHWRPNAGWQTEEHFSDGTLRLLGLLWALLDGDAPLLLEEPELSLHVGVVRHLAPMMNQVQRRRSRQLIVSTHSAELLMDSGIAPEEVILLLPTSEGTSTQLASADAEIVALVGGGLSIGEAALPRTVPQDPTQLSLFMR